MALIKKSTYPTSNTMSQLQVSTTQKYITPSKRNKNNSKESNKSILDEQSFPTLGETMKSPEKKVMNFASAAKKAEEKIETKPIVSDIKPGWIHIRKINGKIQYRHNMINKNTLEEEMKEDKMISDYLYKKRVATQQW